MNAAMLDPRLDPLADDDPAIDPQPAQHQPQTARSALEPQRAAQHRGFTAQRFDRQAARSV